MSHEPLHGPSGETASSMLAMSGLGAEVVDHVPGLGATLAITPTRVVVVRQGAHFRPRTGVRSWPYEMLRDVRLAPPIHGDGRVVLRVGPYPWQAVSLFIAAAEWAAAERVAGKIRVHVARTRREHLGDRSSERVVRELEAGDPDS
jgi:hypothetical protein